MNIGFTGTRSGMTEVQLDTVRSVLWQLRYHPSQPKLHHGDCVGADEQADALAEELDIYRVAHPGPQPKTRAYCEASEIREPRPFLTRNRDIVEETEVLLAAPGTDHEVRRSGTWATVRYARQAGRLIWIIYPDGRIETS